MTQSAIPLPQRLPKGNDLRAAWHCLNAPSSCFGFSMSTDDLLPARRYVLAAAGDNLLHLAVLHLSKPRRYRPCIYTGIPLALRLDWQQRALVIPGEALRQDEANGGVPHFSSIISI